MFNFLLVDNADREEIQLALTEVEDQVIQNVSARENSISLKAKKDAMDVQNSILTA